MIDLVIDPRDPALLPLGPSVDGSKYRQARVTVHVSRTVRLVGGGFIYEGVPVAESVSAEGDPVIVSVPATDGAEIVEADRNTFQYIVTLTTGSAASRTERARRFQGLLPTSLGATVQVTELVNAEPLPAPFLTIGDLLDDVNAAEAAAVSAQSAASAAASSASSAATAAANSATLVGAPAGAAIAANLNAKGTVSDQDYASLEAALTATPTGGVLEVSQAWTRATPWTINKAVTVRFIKAGAITLTADVDGVRVTADDVTLDGVKVAGLGATVTGVGRGISVDATAPAPVRRLRIARPSIAGMRYTGIRLSQVAAFTITGGTISSSGYAGLMIESGLDGVVDSLTVRDVTQPTGYPNSYGIAMTRNSNLTEANAPRSARITVSACTVENVTKWEGIDSHAGDDLLITGNTVRGCRVGIAMVACPDTTGVETMATRRFTITGNNIDSGVTDGSLQDGIIVAGAGATTGSPVEAASGIVAGNTIRGHGLSAASTAGGITCYFTSGLIVAGNTIIEPGVTGVNVYHTNDRLIVSGNTIVDPWTATGAFTAAVYFRSTNNKVTLSGNSLVRGTKTATIVAQRGVFISSATSNTAADLANDWDQAGALAVVDTNNVTAFTTRAKKVGFYGVTPVVRPAAIASPAADVAALKTAVDSIRAALTSLGLTT